VTELDLTAIKKRVEAASAGPWTAAQDGLVWAGRLGDPVSGSTDLEDAEFIAACRTDVPALVAEVERLSRLLGPAEVPSVDAYENVVQALADERAEVVRHCNRIAELTALLAEILGHLIHAGHPGYAAVRSGWIREETVQRWRSAAGGAS